MNRQILVLFIPILALAIPVVAIVLNGMHKMAKLRLEDARLRLQGPDGGTAEEVQSMRSELDTMRAELTELHERVDFAERLLARPERRGGEPPA